MPETTSLTWNVPETTTYSITVCEDETTIPLAPDVSPTISSPTINKSASPETLRVGRVAALEILPES